MAIKRLFSRAVWAITLTVGVTASVYGQECATKTDRPCYDCQSYGKPAKCVSGNAEKISIPVPEWRLHTKPMYIVFGESFESRAPREWTVLEMRVYPDDQNGVPEDSVRVVVARGWVRLCHGRVVFSSEATPSGCPKNERK